MYSIKFRVYALPKPGGSKKAFNNPKTGKPIIVDACKKNKEWRSDVKDAFNDLNIERMLEGPLELHIQFIMPRLKAHFRTNGTLKPNAPYFVVTNPDSTKLLRSTEDAMEGLAYKNDSQVAFQTVTRIYGDKPGCHIVIAEMIEAPLTKNLPLLPPAPEGAKTTKQWLDQAI